MGARRASAGDGGIGKASSGEDRRSSGQGPDRRSSNQSPTRVGGRSSTTGAHKASAGDGGGGRKAGSGSRVRLSALADQGADSTAGALRGSAGAGGRKASTERKGSVSTGAAATEQPAPNTFKPNWDDEEVAEPTVGGLYDWAGRQRCPRRRRTPRQRQFWQ